MTLAVILGLYLLSLAQDNSPARQAQATPSQASEPVQASPSTAQTPSPSNQPQPSKRPRHRKKAISPNCSNSPTPLNPAPGSPADSTNSTGANSASSDSTQSRAQQAATPNTSATALKPCPPPKKVVHNGGSSEPSIQLLGGTAADQAVHQRSTDQLTAATKENLKKVEGRPLNPTQQELVNQITQFMDQSKTAIAAGDAERGHNLAMKAHLLSDELVKP